jgi:integrase
LPRRRFLPPYVTSFADRHGKTRLRFRRKSFDSYYFKSALGTEEFRVEYHACLNPEVGKIILTPITRATPGTIDELVERYYVPPTRLGPSAITQAKVRAVIESFRQGRGDRKVSEVRFDHLDAIIAKKHKKSAVKTASGVRQTGGVHAARKLRKELIRLFDFAMKLKLCDRNPAAETSEVRTTVAERTGGFHCWNEEEIAQFRDHHHLGTRERLGMELLLWTDQRRSDVVKMGRAQIKDGRLPVRQEKTGKSLWLPIAPQLNEAIIAMSPTDTSQFCFLMTRRNKPFTKESFGNFFRKACTAAGLPHCSSHGLRKATLRRMAELEMANKTMKSVSGQTRDDTLAGYTATANQRTLADSAIDTLSKWEMSNLGSVVRHQTANND